MSTAFERVMREQPKLHCLHEPFMYDYYVHRAIRVMPHFDVDPDHPVAYEDIREKIVNLAEESPVFFKDMAYYVYPQVLDDPKFLERITSIFLIRHPEASIVSYYGLDPDLTDEEIGIEAQWNLFSALNDRGKRPIVISAEDLQLHTADIIQQVFERIGLPFDPATLNWENKKPKDWKQVETWHAQAMEATSIKKEVPDAEERRKKFEASATKQPRLEDMLKRHLPYYELLMNNRLRPESA